ncbi:hypothetical protein BY996DRAFT_4420006 [Phakopsora pachyrhizi]|nr:hypothetical protein BY996DRAFT_4420006 [Phakopsora pachyrhizi]
MPPSGGDSPSGARCAIPIITRVAQHNSLPPSPTNIRLSNDHYHSSSEASRLTSSRVLRASQPPASHQGSYHIPSPSDHSSYDGNPRNASSFPQSTLEPQTYGRSQHSRFPAFSSLSPLDPNPTAGPSHNTLTDGTPRAVGLKRKPSRSLSPKPIEARRNSAALDYSDRQPTSDPSQNLSSKSRHMSPASLQHSPAQVSRYSYDRSLGSHSYHPMHPSAHTFNDRVSQGRETSAPSSLSNLLSSEQPIQRYLAEQQEASDPSRMLSREYSRPALAPEFIHGRGWLPSGAMLSDRKNYMLGTPVQNISQPGPRPSSAQDWALYHRSSVSASPQMTRNFALPEKDYPAIREHSSLGCPLSPDSTLHHPQSPDHARGQVSPCPISETSHTLANDIQPQHSRISPVEHRHPHPYPYPSHSYPNHKPAYNCSDSVTSLPPQTSIQPVSSSNERNPSPISSSFRLKFDTHRPYCPPGSHSPTVETNLPRSTIRRTHGSTELLTSNPSHVHLQQSHPYLERSLPASPLSHHTRHDLNLKVNVAHVDRAHMYQQDSRQVFNSSQDLTTHISPREWTMGLYPPSSTAEKSLPQAPFSLANSNSRPIAHYSPKFEHSSKPILSVDQHFSGSPSQVTHFSDQSPHLSHRKPSPGHVFANEENTEEHFFQSNQTSQSQISCQQENSQALTSLQNSSSRELPSNLKQYKRFKLPISNEQDPPTCKESREDKASIRGAPSLLAGNHLKHYNYSHSHPGECPGQLEVLPAENPMQQSLNTALKNTSENSIHTNVVSFSHLENTSGSPQGMLKLSSSHQYQINEELFQEKEKDIEESFTGEFAKEAKKIFLPPKRLCYSEVSERVACSAIDTSGNVYISSPTSRQGSPVITLSCDIKSCDSEAQIQHFPETNLLTSKETNQLKSPEPSQKGTNKLGCSSDYVSLAPEGPRISPQDVTALVVNNWGWLRSRSYLPHMMTWLMM